MPDQFRPLQGSFGAEVIGVAPNLELDEPTFRQVEAAWYKFSILLFRGLTMTPEQQIAFTRRLGSLHYMLPPNITLPEHPEVFVVSNATKDGKPLGLKRAGEGFHSDGKDKNPQCGIVPLRHHRAARTRRYAFCRHVWRLRRPARQHQVQARRPARPLQPYRYAPHPLSVAAGAYRAAETGSAGCPPSDLSLSSEDGSHGALCRTAGRATSRACPSTKAGHSSSGCRSSRNSLALSTRSAGKSATRSFGTIAARSTVQQASTTRRYSHDVPNKSWRVKLQFWRALRTKRCWRDRLIQNCPMRLRCLC